jgi:hypothetical protein
MRLYSWAALILVIMSTGGSAQETESRSAVSEKPMSQEQVAVYRAFLKYYTRISGGEVLHVSNTTELLKPAGIDETCLKGIELENPGASVPAIHRLDSSILIDAKLVLVDPEQERMKIREQVINEGKSTTDKHPDASVAGMLSLSPIIFDKHHQHAIVSFSVYCGEHCGHGSSLLLEKTESGWNLEKNCGSWVALSR